jgi:transposase-like protein
MKKKVNHYTDEFKLKVVQEYLNTDAGFMEVKQKYGLRSNKSIPGWIRKFGLKTPAQCQNELQNAMKEQIQRTPLERELELKVKKLEQELEHERLRTLALNTMIDIAERDLKIKVRKNSGAKQ